MMSVIIPNKGYDKWLTEAIESIKGEVEVIVEHYTDNLANARNRAIQRSKGSHILCLDADDKLYPDFFEMVEESDNIVATGWKFFEGKDDVEIPNKNIDFSLLLQGNQIIISSLFPKKMWEEIGGFDDVQYEDWQFWLKALKKGYKIEVVPFPLVYVRERQDGRNKDAIKNHEKLHKQIREIYENNI